MPLLRNGTSLANRNAMKRQITYKEVLVAFGIIIAVVVALTLWDNHRELSQSSTHNSSSILDGIASAGKTIFAGSIF